MSESGIDYERVVATFLELSRFNAPSRREGAIAAHVAAACRALGAEVVFDRAGEVLEGESGNLIARIPGTIDGPTLLYCAHLDTVEATEGLRVERRDGVLVTDGTTILGADDRAGVAAILEAVRALRETGTPHPPLELVFTVAEEVGVMGSMALDYGLLRSTCGFVPDSSGDIGLIITRAPAQQHLAVTIHGKGAHAGMSPETGVSAIVVAARAIARMRHGRIDDETTANIGIIQGGKATNIVADLVTLEGEARSRDPRKLAEQVAHMRACLEDEAAAAGARAEVIVSEVYPAFTLDASSLPVRLASAAARTLDITPLIATTGGGSDANFFNNRGIPTVVLSAGYRHNHGHDENLPEHQLELLARMLFEIARLAGLNTPAR